MTGRIAFVERGNRLLKNAIRGLLYQLFNEDESVFMMDIELSQQNRQRPIRSRVGAF